MADAGIEAGTVVRQDRLYRSTALGREAPCTCLMPADALTSRKAYPLLLLLHGHNGKSTDWATYTRLKRHLAGRDLIVACPDGGNGWYTNAVEDGELREDDLVHDLLTELQRTLPIRAGGHAIAGLSMGGYGALKLALKHPRLFRVAAGFSGAYDITSRPAPHPVFGDPDADAAFRRKESVAWLAEQALCRPAAERPSLHIDCGLSDPLLEANRSLSSHLNFIGYGHVYREARGHHTWPYWDRALRGFLDHAF